VRRALGAAVVAAGTALPATGALALLGDQVELSAAETVSHDDNVFRLSSAQSSAAVLGTPSKGDTFHTTTFGLRLDVPVSRQRIQADLALNDTRYDQFSVLNLKGHNARARLLWLYGDRLTGQAGISESLTLASLANVQSGVQSSTPNSLTTIRSFVNANYLLAPRWQLRGELGRFSQSNEVPERRVNDIEIDSVDAGLSYVTPAGNQLGVGLRLDDAHLPQQQPVAGALIDNSYRQQSVAIIGEWTLSGHSRLSGRAGWVVRNYRQVPQRDYEGTTYRLAYDWRPTAKLSLNAATYREISPFEEINVSFVLASGIALRPTYRWSEKIDLSAVLDYSRREYLGDVERATGILPPRTDRVRLGLLSIAYRPLQSVSLGLTLRRETRGSTDAFGDYSSNTVSVRARIAF